MCNVRGLASRYVGARSTHDSDAEVWRGLTMTDSPYAAAVLGAIQTLAHSSNAGWILLCVVAIAIASAIAHHDGSRVRRAEQHAALELLRR